MKKDPVLVAKQTLEALGGKENIVNATHCATRLRVSVRDASLVDSKAITDIPGVAGYFEKSGQHQVILGTGFVNKVHDQFVKLAGVGGQEVQEGPPEELNFQTVTKMISDIFIPIIPVLLATGILMGVRSLLVSGFGLEISPEINTIFSVLTDTAYTFIPVLVAWSACKKFGGSPVLGLVLGLMLVSPNLPDKWAVVNGTAEALHMHLGPLPIDITGYQSSVIPALAMGVIAANLEKVLHKVIPDIVDLLLVPFLTLLISLIVGLMVVGPALSLVERVLTDLILMMLKLPLGIGGIAYGGLIQLLCSVGMHHTVTPIIVSLYTETGVDFINPMGSAAIAGQLGAGIAIVMMEQNKRKRTDMIPALVPALFGISEPVMYGMTFPRIKPFLMGCVGGAVGGGFAALVGLAAKGTGASMIPGMLLYLQGGMIQYIITLVLATGVGCAGTLLIMKNAKEADTQKEVSKTGSSDAFKDMGKSDVVFPVILDAVAEGDCIPMEEISDPTFSTGVLGQCCGINPVEGKVYAPADGTISQVADSMHVIGIQVGELELLIHVGVDTVDMNGDGFDCKVKEGQSVKKGDLILTMDLNKIRAAGHATTVVFIVTNSDDFSEVKTLATGSVQLGTGVIRVNK